MTGAIVAIAIATSIQVDAAYALAEKQQHVILPPVVQYTLVKQDEKAKPMASRVIETTNVYSERQDNRTYCEGAAK